MTRPSRSDGWGRDLGSAEANHDESLNFAGNQDDCLRDLSAESSIGRVALERLS